MKMTFTHRELPHRTRFARHSRLPLPRRSLITAGALSALLLAGCSSGSNPASSSSQGLTDKSATQGGSAERNSSGSTKPGAKADAAAPGAPADASKSGAPKTVVGPKLTKSASLDLQVKDVGVAAARVRSIAASLNAQVISEQIGKGGPGNPIPLEGDRQTTIAFNGFGTMTLSVPADKLDSALDQLGKIATTVLQRNTSSQDVTSQYVDTQSRLKTMRASVERVRALMAQARDLGQVVSLESEVSRREADLESLQSQLEALTTSVERSTLAVTLSTGAGTEPVSDSGFMAGLRAGWDAFTDSARGLLTGIGAVLPFAVLLALIGAPAWRWWRRRQGSRASSTPPTATPAPAPAP